MIQPLRNLARRWANTLIVRTNDALRHDLIRAQATIARQTQTMRQGEHALYVATGDLAEATATIKELRDELTAKTSQIERQADLFDEYRTEIESTRRQRDEACARVEELEELL